MEMKFSNIIKNSTFIIFLLFMVFVSLTNTLYNLLIFFIPLYNKMSITSEYPHYMGGDIGYFINKIDSNIILTLSSIGLLLLSLTLYKYHNELNGVKKFLLEFLFVTLLLNFLFGLGIHF